MTTVWPQDVLTAMADGAISPVEAFRKLREMDMRSKSGTTSTVNAPQQKLEDIFRELDSLIGLTEVKSLVREIHAFIEIQKRRQKSS